MVLKTGDVVDFIYFYKSEGCSYCNYFKETKEALKYETQGEFVELDCVKPDNLEIAKKIFNVKIVPSLAIVVNKKFCVVDDLSQLSLEQLKEKIQKAHDEHF